MQSNCYTAGRYASPVYAVAVPCVSPSVRPSVTRRYCTKMQVEYIPCDDRLSVPKPSITQTTSTITQGL